MKRISLKQYLKENARELESTSVLSEADKAQFLEACKNYSQHRGTIPDRKAIQAKMNEIAWIVEMAEAVTLNETEEWFDNVTVSRHMKQLKESYKILEKTGKELITTQQRFESAYEDIGQILQKYYNVG